MNISQYKSLQPKENMLSYSFVICLCIYFFVKQINSLLNLYKDAAGIWHEDRFRPLTKNVRYKFILINEHITIQIIATSVVIPT